MIFFPRTASTQSTLYPYFSVWLKNSKGTILIFYEERNLGKRDSHVTKLLRNEWKEWISLLITYCSRFHFSSVCFFFFYVFVLFFIFRADTSLFLFHLIFENLILHTFLIIIIIIPCSGIFRNVPRSWFYRHPARTHVFNDFKFWKSRNR